MSNPLPFGPVAHALVGDNGPSVRPGDDAAFYGSVRLLPDHPVEARSYQTLRLIYTVGKLGIDDTGAMQVAFRVVSDVGKPQIRQPSAPNYITALSTGEGSIRLDVSDTGLRPWNRIITAHQSGGYLREGDEIEIVFGDTSYGSPGWAMQTFVEAGFEFRVSADVQATGNFLPLGQQITVPVVPGPAVRWRAVLPSLRRPGETFHFGLKAEDLWGNPTGQANGHVRLIPSLPVDGLPLAFHYAPDDRAMAFEGLSVAEDGELRIRVFVDDEEVCEAGPLIIKDGEFAGFWGDLHGQSGETVGIGTIESYFDFARNKAFLDVTAHQGNDFQINTAFWERLNTLTGELDTPGRFVVFPGYEWSGNTAVGGDHNVFFRREGEQIHRCSHALLEDRSDLETDCTTLPDLYQALSGKDAVMYAHVGGRYADIAYDHDPTLETAVEVHSAWGTFEWILTDGFELGRRVGVVCNSDGHKGRPGASYPGTSQFGAYGGLTCFLSDRLDRDAIFEAMRRRHHYGTTGCRMHIDLSITLPEPGILYERNPDVRPDAGLGAQPDAQGTAPPAAGTPATRVMMGDIVRTSAKLAKLQVEIAAHAGIARVELRRGADVLETIRPYTPDQLGDRIRVLWSGAEYRGRGRNTTWKGRVRVLGRTISQWAEINGWNPERPVEQRGRDTLVWDMVTTGNFAGVDIWLSGAGQSGADEQPQPRPARLEIATNHGNLDLALDDIGAHETVLDAGGLGRRLTVARLPADPLPRTLQIERDVPLRDDEHDTPIWITVTTEDGNQAWTSPVYLIR